MLSAGRDHPVIYFLSRAAGNPLKGPAARSKYSVTPLIPGAGGVFQ